ncbi:MAG TPA: helix-hairpin-helix domain-containing protein [Verrucomicrobiae bacterium]|nr:helix-hairpin-helix domain-containing protein [Verrucomicrobiae bacterium]
MNRDSETRSADLDLGYIDLNDASEKDLAQIPFIGDKLARDIIEHRPFMHMDDLRKVPGVDDYVIDELLRGGAVVGNTQPPKAR